ncbi:MAG: LysR family transcriptional regulator [Gammaproteobacteria bacterium]
MILNIRQIKNFIHIARLNSISRAAEELNRSQSAVSRSLQELENQLGVSLFDRNVNGVMLTAFGKALLRRAEYIERVFQKAREVMMATEHGMRDLRENSSVFRMDVSSRRLASFIAMAERHNVARAAAKVDTTTAAVRNTTRELESSLGVRLFERGATGLTPSIHGKILYKYVKLVSNELRQAVDEVASLQGVKQGHVRVGTLAFSQTTILPSAIIRLLKSYPDIEVSTVEGSYDSLIHELHCGDIDFTLGALRPPSVDDELKQEALLEDDLSLIVKYDHELLKRPAVSGHDLMQYGWVLPPEDAPSRHLFEKVMARMGLGPPRNVIETRSQIVMRSLLLESDRISVLSRHQIYYEEKYGMLSVVPFQMAGTRRPIGVTFRAHSTLSPSAQLLLDEIRHVTAEIK